MLKVLRGNRVNCCSDLAWRLQVLDMPIVGDVFWSKLREVDFVAGLILRQFTFVVSLNQHILFSIRPYIILQNQ